MGDLEQRLKVIGREKGDLIEEVRKRDRLVSFSSSLVANDDTNALFNLISKKLRKVVDAESTYLLRVERLPLGNDMALYAYLEKGDNSTLQKTLVAHLNIETMSSTIWNPMEVTCIEDVAESELFEDNINSVFRCNTSNIIIVPVASNYLKGTDTYNINTFDCLGYIAILNCKGGAENGLKRHKLILQNIALQIHRRFFEDDSKNKNEHKHLEQIKKMNVQLARYQKERELTKQRIGKETERFDKMKAEFKIQLKSERDKVTEEIRKKIVLKEGWEKMEKLLQNKLETMRKDYKKDKITLEEKYESKLLQLKTKLEDEKKNVMNLKKECKVSSERLSDTTRRYHSEERERQVEFKRELSNAEHDLSIALQNNSQLQESYDTMKASQEKELHKSTRTLTKLESELARLKKVHEYEKARRIELEQREEMLSSQLSDKEITHQHEITSMEQEYNRKLNDMKRQHKHDKSLAVSSSARAQQLRKRLDTSEKALKERGEKEIYIIKKLEDQMSNAIVELRRKNNELEEARVAAQVSTDAKRRIETIVETQRVEMEQLREYRSMTVKLHGQIEDNAREKVHLETALNTMRREIDKQRRENVQLRTQLTKLNPIQTSLEIELDKARGVENDLKKEIMILQAEVEKEAKDKHDLTRNEVNKSQLIEKERREVVRLRTEANELRNEVSKLHRKNEELVEDKAAMLHLANSQKEEVTRMEETYKERVSMLQNKIYTLKRSNKETEINAERKNIELKSTREDLHHSNLRYQELNLTRQEDVKKLTLDIEETKEMFEDKKNQVEVLSNSVNALQDDKNYLVRKVQHLEGQLRAANDEIDTVQTSSQMKISELERSLVGVKKESERYRSKHQDLKRLMLREASEVVSERLIANKFDNKKFEDIMEQSTDKL